MTANIYPARGPVRWYLKATGFWGITLPPFGVFVLAEYLHDEKLKRHEMAHWEQAQRLGSVKFYVQYLWLLARYGYQNHPMEIEARAAEI
jgi:hypothetical protein